MDQFRICPRCDQHLDTERHFGVFLCTCGWADPTGERAAKKSVEKKTSILLGVSMILLALGFSHLVSWGEYSLAAPVLRLRQATGLLSAHGYNQLADACLATGRFSCAENAYVQAFEESKQPSEILKAAKLQMRLSENESSRQSFLRYFKAGGKDQTAMVKYGNLLEANKDETKALKMYQQAYQVAITGSKAKPAELPIQAMSGIVRILMKQGRHREVYSRIVKFHNSSETAKGYLNVELAQVREVIRAKFEGQRSLASARGS